MSILTRKPVSVEELAQNLSAAESTREERIALAQQDFEAQRQSVLEQGRERAAELRRLEAEARTEAERAEALIDQARSKQ